MRLANRTLLKCLAPMLALPVAIAPVLAQDLPTSALTSYDSFRAALLRYGWRPDQAYGIKDSAGKPMYVHPEVICGNSLCTAQWIARNGKKLNLTLWPDSSGEYRVAAQIDWK